MTATVAPATRANVIIAAARKFGCAHRFVLTKEDRVFSFVCELCEHRTEDLPVIRLRITRGARVIQFSPGEPLGSAQPVPSHHGTSTAKHFA